MLMPKYPLQKGCTLDPYVSEAIGKAIKHGAVMIALTTISLLPLFIAARSLSDLGPDKASYPSAVGANAARNPGK